MKEKLLKEISESESFTENNIFQFCVDNDYDIGTVTSTINKLIDTGEIVKCYYCSYECRFSSEPICENSYMILTVKLHEFNSSSIDELMKDSHES